MIDNLYAQFTHPDCGYEFDIILANSILIKDIYYPVYNVAMGQSQTRIRLPDGWFNSVQFTFFKKTEDNFFVEHDIYNDPVYNPYL